MTCRLAPARRALAGTVWSLLLLGTLPVVAQDITRVEEDWIIRVVDPDTDLTAPQFTTVMTPDSTDPSTYFTLEFNHSTTPEFQPGGLQLQAWQGDALHDASDRLSEQSLDTDNEDTRWTQFMEMDGGSVVFGISSLSSQTWGDVNPADYRLSMPAWSGDDLNDYQYNDTTEYSAVGYAGNRVAWMYLLEVRMYSGDTLVQRVVVNRNVNRGGQ